MYSVGFNKRTSGKIKKIVQSKGGGLNYLSYSSPVLTRLFLYTIKVRRNQSLFFVKA